MPETITTEPKRYLRQDGNFFIFVREGTPDAKGGYPLEQLADDEVIVSPGLVYRRIAMTDSEVTPETPKEWSDYINCNREAIVRGRAGESQPCIIELIQIQAFNAGVLSYLKVENAGN